MRYLECYVPVVYYFSYLFQLFFFAFFLAFLDSWIFLFVSVFPIYYFRYCFLILCMVTLEVTTCIFSVTRSKINQYFNPSPEMLGPHQALSPCKETRVNPTFLCPPHVSPVVEGASWLNTWCRKAACCSQGTQRENWPLSSRPPT